MTRHVSLADVWLTPPSYAIRRSEKYYSTFKVLLKERKFPKLGRFELRLEYLKTELRYFEQVASIRPSSKTNNHVIALRDRIQKLDIKMRNKRRELIEENQTTKGLPDS